MGTHTSPLLYFDIVDSAEDDVGRILIWPSSERLNAQLLAASFQGATVTEVRPHSFVLIGRHTDATRTEPVTTKANCSLSEDYGHSSQTSVGQVFLSAERGLCLTARSCACMQSENWEPGGVVFKGFGVVQHMAHSVQHRKENFTVSECGEVPPNEKFLGESSVDHDIFPDDPANAFLSFTNIEKVYQAAVSIKASGSVLFRMERYHIAMYQFSKAVRYVNQCVETGVQLSPEEQQGLLSITVPSILNTAACKLRLRDFDGALEDCNEAMELAPSNHKVYYRRGQAHHGKLNYEQSLYDLYRALKLAPNDKSVKNEIAAVEGALEVYGKSNSTNKNSRKSSQISSSSSS